MSQSIFDRVIRAIQANDRNGFLMNATDDMRQSVTPELMDSISQDLAPYLAGGFEATHLRQWEEDGFEVNVWRIASKDGSDDVLLRLVTRDEQLAGLWRDCDAPQRRPLEQTAT